MIEPIAQRHFRHVTGEEPIISKIVRYNPLTTSTEFNMKYVKWLEERFEQLNEIYEKDKDKKVANHIDILC